MFFAEGAVSPDLTQLLPWSQFGTFGCVIAALVWIARVAFPTVVELLKKQTEDHKEALKVVTDSAEKRLAREQESRDRDREKFLTSLGAIEAAMREIGQRVMACPHNEYEELAALKVLDRRKETDTNYKGPLRRAED